MGYQTGATGVKKGASEKTTSDAKIEADIDELMKDDASTKMKGDKLGGGKGSENKKIQKYTKDIPDEFGNIDNVKMNKLRLAIQNGTFNKDEISLISKEMSEKGITKEYETAMKKVNFGTYLRNIEGEPPADMINSHAHHILFKTGNGESQKQLVEEGQAILRKYGIDPVVGPENLVWAPNGIVGQHGEPALQKVVEALRAVDEEGGDYEDIVKVLKRLGRTASRRK